MLKWGYRVILLFGLIWGHRMANRTTLFIGSAQPQGIQPITKRPLPLSSDDIARGLLSRPSENVTRTVLKQAHETRYILSQHQDELRRIRLHQQSQAIRLFQTLEKP